eukprot:m.11084 g.11084  ORF g.11084 m.11084 type:complete len:86 (+) comp22970_c0_seq1:1210-1467(+)
MASKRLAWARQRWPSGRTKESRGRKSGKSSCTKCESRTTEVALQRKQSLTKKGVFSQFTPAKYDSFYTFCLKGSLSVCWCNLYCL